MSCEKELQIGRRNFSAAENSKIHTPVKPLPYLTTDCAQYVPEAYN